MRNRNGEVRKGAESEGQEQVRERERDGLKVMRNWSGRAREKMEK